MDSRFAVIFFLMGATDTYLNDCEVECLRETNAPARISLQYGDTFYQRDEIGSEIFAIYDVPKMYGAIQPVMGASITSDNDLWVGAGGKWTTERTVSGPLFIEASLMPGFYMEGRGPDLGFPVQWRGSLGAGVKVGDAGSFMIYMDHRSNANLSETNPGIETVGLRLTYNLE
jgi:lipid A 3-O-deacylase